MKDRFGPTRYTLLVPEQEPARVMRDSDGTLYLDLCSPDRLGADPKNGVKYCAWNSLASLAADAKRYGWQLRAGAA